MSLVADKMRKNVLSRSGRGVHDSAPSNYHILANETEMALFLASVK